MPRHDEFLPSRTYTYVLTAAAILLVTLALTCHLRLTSVDKHLRELVSKTSDTQAPPGPFPTRGLEALNGQLSRLNSLFESHHTASLADHTAYQHQGSEDLPPPNLHPSLQDQLERLTERLEDQAQVARALQQALAEITELLTLRLVYEPPPGSPQALPE